MFFCVYRDLVEFLREQKAIAENKDVLEEINFRTNGVNYYSDDIEDALFNLQTIEKIAYAYIENIQ